MTAMKKQQRLRRARRARFKMRERGMVRLCVNRTPRHIYAQIISPDGASVLASASTLDKELRGQEGGKKEAAASVGKLVAERRSEERRVGKECRSAGSRGEAVQTR